MIRADREYTMDWAPLCEACSQPILPTQAAESTGHKGFSGLQHAQCELPFQRAANDAR